MKTFKPTTPSRRQMSVVDYSVLSKDKPHKALLKKLPKHAGRNNSGRITARHQGGENKKLYRVVDFKQDRLDVPAKVLTLEYDPYRSSFICLIGFEDGEKRYILAQDKLKVGDEVIASENAPLKVGNRAMLKNIQIGTQVSNIELKPGRGGQTARSAGSYGEILAHEDGYTNVKMASKEVRKINWNCFASIGPVSNPDHFLANYGKAGKSRWKGVRPTVRGTAMNPVDHPYGGGEGRQRRGTKRPKTAWGKITGGRKTRSKKKWSNKLILKRRSK